MHLKKIRGYIGWNIKILKVLYWGIYWWTFVAFWTITLGSQHTVSIIGNHKEYQPPLYCSKMRQLFLFTGGYWLSLQLSIMISVKPHWTALKWNQLGYCHLLTRTSTGIQWRSLLFHGSDWWALVLLLYWGICTMLFVRYDVPIKCNFIWYNNNNLNNNNPTISFDHF